MGRSEGREDDGGIGECGWDRSRGGRKVRSEGGREGREDVNGGNSGGGRLENG